MTPAKSIVIVDDSADLVYLYQDYLRGEGFNVHVATGGKSALALIDELAAVDLLLVDCLMPGMNGASFLQELIKRKPELRKRTRIIGMSGLVPEAHEISEMRPHVDRMVEKTSDLLEFLNVILEA